MSIENYEILRQAIGRNSPAVLGLPSAGMIRHHKTRFLGEAADGFWLEITADTDRPLVDTLMAEKAQVGLVFKSGNQSVMFTSPIKLRDGQYRINGTTKVEALFMAFPLDFARQQRRQTYRAVILPDQATVRLWRIAEHAVLRDRPLASVELFAKLDDLSVTGFRVHGQPGRDHLPAVVLPNERLRILLTWGKGEILTEGRLMHRRDLENKVSVMGIHFKKMEKDIEGRQMLAKLTELVGVLQREEIKRHRLLAG